MTTKSLTETELISIAETHNKIERGAFSNLRISDINIIQALTPNPSGITNLQFVDVVFTNVRFRKILFTNCEFINVQFINCNFDLVTFDNCSFDESDFCSNTHTSNTCFNVCIFKDLFIKNVNYDRTQFTSCTFSSSSILESTIRWTTFIGNKFEFATIKNTHFIDCKMNGSNFTKCDVKFVSFPHTNMSNTTGLIEFVDLKSEFKITGSGLYAFKQFGLHYEPPSYWKIIEGGFIEETCNPDITTECGCGISVATPNWISVHGCCSDDVWLVQIPIEVLPYTIVPINYDGKIRTPKVKIIKNLGRLKDIDFTKIQYRS